MAGDDIGLQASCWPYFSKAQQLADQIPLPGDTLPPVTSVYCLILWGG